MASFEDTTGAGRMDVLPDAPSTAMRRHVGQASRVLAHGGSTGTPSSTARYRTHGRCHMCFNVKKSKE